MVVRFKTNKRKNDIGAQCMMKCVKGEGLPRLRAPFENGNLFINFTIEFPDSMDASVQSQLLKLLADLDCNGTPAFVRRIEHIANEPVALRPCLEAADLDLRGRAGTTRGPQRDSSGRGFWSWSGVGGQLFLLTRRNDRG